MKSGFEKKKELKVAIYICRLIFYSVKKMFLNSVFVSVKVICCFSGIWQIILDSRSYVGNILLTVIISSQSLI